MDGSSCEGRDGFCYVENHRPRSCREIYIPRIGGEDGGVGRGDPEILYRFGKFVTIYSIRFRRVLKI